MRRLISLSTLSMVVALSLSALEAGLTPEIGATETVVGSKDTRYDLKLQLATVGEAGISLGIGPITVGPYLGLHYTGASSISGGYAYRGFRGWHWGGRVGIRGKPLEIGRSLSLRPGLRAGGSVRYSRLQYTELIFFYPQIGVAPYVDVGRARDTWWARFLLPIDVYFRRDLDYSVSMGLGVELAWDIVEAASRYTRR